MADMPGSIQYDEQRRPYIDTPRGRNYISPVAMGTGQRPEDTTGLFRSGPQWDANKGQWVTPIDWSNVANVAVGSALGAGAISAATAGGAASTGASSAAGGVLPNAALPGASGAMTAGLPTATASMTTGAGAAGGGSWLAGMNTRDMIGAAGAGINGASQQSATNRGAQFYGQRDLEQLLLDREKQTFDQGIAREVEGRASGTDAWRKLMAAERVSNPGPRPNVSPYSVGPRVAGESELAGADAMRTEVMARLTGGNPIQMPAQRPMNVDPRLLQSGGMERAGNWLGPIMSAYGRGGR